MSGNDSGFVDVGDISGCRVAVTEGGVFLAVVGDDCPEIRWRGLVQFVDEGGR